MPFSISSAPPCSSHPIREQAQLPWVELEITRGQARRRVRKVEVPVFLIGTADDCDLVLGDPQFPEVHSYLFLSADGVWVRRLGSEPAGSVEGRLVKSAQLCDGDHVRMGAYEFRVRTVDANGFARVRTAFDNRGLEYPGMAAQQRAFPTSV